MILLKENGHGHSGAALHHHYAFCDGVRDHIFGSGAAFELKRRAVAFRCKLHLPAIFEPILLDGSINNGIRTPNSPPHDRKLRKHHEYPEFSEPVVCLSKTTLYNGS